jgi:hypothetical protein
MRLVCELLVAHHPHSQAKEILCFWTLRAHVSVKMVITAVKADVITQESLETRKKSAPCYLVPYIE